VAASQVRNAANTGYEANPLGNVINNAQTDRAKVDFNLKKIYDKVPFLRTYSSQTRIQVTVKPIKKRKKIFEK
jgi:hypothetical protein